jgi:hypothetical protein
VIIIMLAFDENVGNFYQKLKNFELWFEGWQLLFYPQTHYSLSHHLQTTWYVLERWTAWLDHSGLFLMFNVIACADKCSQYSNCEMVCQRHVLLCLVRLFLIAGWCVKSDRLL